MLKSHYFQVSFKFKVNFVRGQINSKLNTLAKHLWNWNMFSCPDILTTKFRSVGRQQQKNEFIYSSPLESFAEIFFKVEGGSLLFLSEFLVEVWTVALFVLQTVLA